MKIPNLYDRRLVLMHIEKTGGTTLTKLLSDFYSEKEICPERLNAFTFWIKEHLHRFKFFSAHMDTASLRAIPDPKTAVLILRDPVLRALSYYEFLRYHDPSTQHPEPKILVAQSLPVDRFFEEAPPSVLESVSNYMTAQLAATHGKVGRHAYKLAIENLELFAHIGISEDLEDLIGRLGADIGVRIPSDMLHANRTFPMLPANHPLRVRVVEDRTIQRIRDLNEYDIELYEHIIRHYCPSFRGAEKAMLDEVGSVRHVTNPDGEKISFCNYFQGAVAYGPYKRVLAGKKSVTFRLSASGFSDSSPDQVFATIDVYSGTLGGVLAERPVRAQDISPDKLSDLMLDFYLSVTVSDLEFRIHAKSNCRLFWSHIIELRGIEHVSQPTEAPPPRRARKAQ